MRAVKNLFLVVSYSLLIIQGFIIGTLLYNKTLHKRELYYGNAEKKPAEISQIYFSLLQLFLYSTLILMIAWAVLTPFVVISNKRSPEKDKVEMGVGIGGFIVAVILLITDPFGIFKWFTNR